MNSHKRPDLGMFSKNRPSKELSAEMINKNIWVKGCPIPIDRLMLLNLSYVDYEGTKKHNGQMVVFDVVADSVLKIFQELYLVAFPINSINLMNQFDGDDNKSMNVNNTSSFNGRKIANTTRWSVHSYGMAIDINPIQNPCLDTEYKPGKQSVDVFPAQGIEYMNRSNLRQGMVESVIDESINLTVVELFKDNGFSVWGGAWNFPIDLHHFQVPTDEAKKLANMSFDEGMSYFSLMLQNK
ncbi:MAG: M15 family metallopeptidase [Rickettsiales bacterium]|nr:M15 family metallopeptidase [Rickettsiales bacterium]